MALASMFFATSCDSSLKREKVDAILKLSQNNPCLLKKTVLEKMEIQSGKLGSESIEVEGGTIFAASPIRRTQNEKGVTLDYPGFSAQIVNVAGGDELSSLPLAWGNDDLEKLRSICGASQSTIEAASNLDELNEAVALLKARATVAPIGASDRLILLEGDRFTGLLSGDFAKSAWMELLFRPIRAPRANFLVSFRHKDAASHNDILEFVRSLDFNPIAHQPDTGRPATRPESKPEGGAKPQLEAEGRSQHTSRLPSLGVRSNK